jgi:hypothetical protein
MVPGRRSARSTLRQRIRATITLAGLLVATDGAVFVAEKGGEIRSNPTGLRLTVGSSTSATPFTRTVIVGSRNTIAAPLAQTLNGTSYASVVGSGGG